MSRYSSEMTARSWSNPDIDIENPYFAASVTWTWPAGNYWSHVQLVRTDHAPAHRIEEGRPLLKPAEEGQPVLGRGVTREEWPDQNNTDGVPTYVDEQPSPGVWVFYTLFALDIHRVWTKVAHAATIGPDDFGWSVRLPELLPGASVSASEQMVEDPAAQSSEVVQFLQSPASEIDIAVSLGEAMQFYWDPLRCPPQFLPALAESWGYRYNEPIGMARNRAILGALRIPTQGSLYAITEVASAVMGTPAVVSISNNLMLDQDDSSWENGDFTDTRWGPKPDPEDVSPPIEVRAHDPLFPPPLMAPNLMKDYFLLVHEAGTWKCGYVYDDEVGDWVLDPVRGGIPISQWDVVRLGCYARDDNSSAATITLGMDIHDQYGALLGTLTYIDSQPLIDQWEAVPDTASPPDPIPLTSIYPALITDSAFRDPARWTALTDPYANPQIAVTDQTAHMLLQFTDAPTTDGPSAMWAISSMQMPGGLVVGETYTATAVVNPLESQVSFQLAVSDGAGTVAASGYGTGLVDTPQTLTVTWQHIVDQEIWVGIEVRQPVDGWADGVTTLQVRLESLTMTETPKQHAYGVPWFTVSDACAIDVFIADDGEG